MAMDPSDARRISRRLFRGHSASGLGLIALGQLLGQDVIAQEGAAAAAVPKGEAARRVCRIFHRRAKRVIYLFQSGAPSQLDLFDYKPLLQKCSGTDLPDVDPPGSAADRHDGSAQDSFPVVPSMFKFAQHGQVGRVVQRTAAAHGAESPTTCASSNRCTPSRSITTRPSRSSKPDFSWPGGPASARGSVYGLGRENKDLPAFVVHDLQRPKRAISRFTIGCGAPASCRASYQGVKLRSVGDPVLYISDPEGFDRERPATLHRRSGKKLNNDDARDVQ